MNNRLWLKLLFIILFTITLSIGIFNYYIDPYGYFSRENKFINNITRVNKAEILNTKLYANGQIYIIGTSRQMRVNPQLIENLTQKATHNVNITGSTFSENTLLAKKIKKLGKNFIYGFDCTSLNKYRVENFSEITNRYVTYKEELKSYKNIYLALLNFDITLLSINHILDRLNNKDYYQIENHENNHPYSINSKVIIGGVDGTNKKASYSSYTIYPDKEIIDLAKSANNDDIFVILPKYIAWYKMFQKYNNIEDKYFHSIKILVRETKAKVWIFYGNNTITRDSKNFDTNGWHFRPKIANLIFERIYNKNIKGIPKDFGILLTPKNIDTVLLELKNNLKEYQLDKNIFKN